MQDSSEISPLIEKWHPNATHDQKVEYTQDLRQFVSALYDLHERFAEIDLAAEPEPEGKNLALTMGSESICSGKN